MLIHGNYVIKNKKNCYIRIIKNKRISCENVPYQKAGFFNLIRLYEEVKNNKLNAKIIEKEPIDVLIKYIDLRDLNLERNNFHQIQKDFDNEELKYSIRSILKNIPWVRKIFILMPNEKVRFFKNNSLIGDKIIYVKDKDLIGFESSNANAFLFRYWKMKKFGISDNFIVMDDDYFIGKKLKKTDFFYIENGKVVPSIVSSKFLRVEKDLTIEKIKLYKSRLMNCKEEQNDDAFNYSLQITYLLMMKEFKIDLMNIPKFTHNAIPVNLNELREIYNLVYSSKYKFSTLYSLYRQIGYVQFQSCYFLFIFLKYKRKVIDISNKFIVINRSFSSNYNYALFCINKGPFNYSFLDEYKAKITMEYLFPSPTPYEVINNNNLIDISFNIVKTMEINMSQNDEKIKDIFKLNSKKFLKKILLTMSFLFFLKIYSIYSIIILFSKSIIF